MATEEQEEEVKANPAWKIALVGGPLFLILSSAWAMWIWYQQSLEETLDSRLALPAQAVSLVELDDHLRKTRELIGARGWDTPEGRTNMRRAIAFIEGTLSPQNYGFRVQRGGTGVHAGELWPTLWVDLKGTKRPREVVAVPVPYDAGSGSVPAALVAANALRGDKFERTIRFVFFPADLPGGAGGADLEAFLDPGQSLAGSARVELSPELRARQPTSADLKPVAEELVRAVWELANDPRKNP